MWNVLLLPLGEQSWDVCWGETASAGERRRLMGRDGRQPSANGPPKIREGVLVGSQGQLHPPGPASQEAASLST